MMRIPRGTYRLQFTPEFGFREAMELIPYLENLGISDLYASPVFRARSGSEHGYDVVDPLELNPDLGSLDDFIQLSSEVRKRNMGWLQDIVPNHMAFDAQNPYLVDIFENGPASPYYQYFDIDWNHYYEGIRGKVLAPFLGSFYGMALENGELELKYDEQGFAVTYYDLQFPLRIESYLTILSRGVSLLQQELADTDPDAIQLLGILYVLKTLHNEMESEERRKQVRFIKQGLWTLYRQNELIQQSLDASLQKFNGRVGEPESFNDLEALLGEQWFRLSYWKVASEEINYRRFFSINDLLCVRIEDDEVFRKSHALIFHLLQQGHFTGLRIDHIDGLYDPETYLRSLRQEIPESYLLVEKILEPEETLPDWPIQGTTGYDYLNVINSLFCQADNEKAFSGCYRSYTRLKTEFQELVYQKKKLIIERHLFGDVNNLAHLLKMIAGRYRYSSDITMDSLKQALIEMLTLFPVYRSYLSPGHVRDADRRYISEAANLARDRNPALLNELDCLERVLLGQLEDHLSQEDKAQWLHFAMRFQQVSGPLMAKGFEDTLFYVYNRFISLNEVGGSPDRFGLSLNDFHAINQRRQRTWPYALSATSTHDCKRGEDVRARLNVLSEIPQEWRQQVRRWSELNRKHKQTVKRCKVPDKNDEYFFYQTLVGAFPVDRKDLTDFTPRVTNYLLKAVREAKIHTAWLKPDSAYEEAFLDFAEKLLDPEESHPFLAEFIPFQNKVAHFGRLNSLSQVLLKIATPGVPDFYQGTEFWDLNLVDPDNRRPVDYSRRNRVLQDIMQQEETDLPILANNLLQNMEDGRIKLFLTHRALKARQQKAHLFQSGDYLPIQVSGPAQEHIVAFARRWNTESALVVVPRFLAGCLKPGELPQGKQFWGDTNLDLTALRDLQWFNVFTGARFKANSQILLSELLQDFPLGLLLGE